jgi:toxin ParE1/3/4
MRHIRISDAAENDLVGIGDYTETRWGPLKCEEYLTSIVDCVEMLASNPHMGISRADIRKGLYSWLHGSHLIFYRFDDEVIEVGRILHSSMDVVLNLGADSL